MDKNLIELNKKNFDKFVKENKVVVDFWAPWCGPCKIMEPIFNELSQEMKDKAKFGKVNVDEDLELAQRFNVMAIPTTIIFRDGQQADRFVGAISKAELVKKIKDVK